MKTELQTTGTKPTEEMPLTPADVRDMLILTKKGAVLQCKRNCVTVLENDPHLKGAFRCNILSGRTDIVRDLGWRRPSPAINDTDMSYIYLYLEDHYSLTSEKHIDSAIRIVADRNSYHPVCEFLDNLKWDGQERISKLLPRFFGVSTDDGYYTPQLLYDCTKLFLMGGIVRAHNPGIKFDYMLCLAGGQGAGKSTFFRFLAHNDDWFTDDLKKIDDDNIYRQLQGHWVCEMPEMIEPSNPRKRDQVKAFITRQKDSYKVPYDVYPMDRPRQCVFGGTTNIVQFLPFDRTGNRRFIPFEINEERREVHILDKDHERENRYFIDQVWAEAMALYRKGDYTLALSTEDEHRLDIIRKHFMPEDTMAGQIQQFLDDRLRSDLTDKHVCSILLFKEALHHEFDEPKRFQTNEICSIMNTSIVGWIEGPVHRFAKYGTQKSWIPAPGAYDEQLRLDEEEYAHHEREGMEHEMDYASNLYPIPPP